MDGSFGGTEQKPTHVQVKSPRLSMSRLADYMGASRQAQRSIIQSCKYQPIARVVQHKEARIVITNYLRDGHDNHLLLVTKANELRHKLADDDFELEVNGHNADYVERFSAVVDNVQLPVANLQPPHEFDPIDMNGVSLSFRPQILLSRLTQRTNKLKIGALMLRYAKGKSLVAKVANWQAAGIFGFLRTIKQGEAAEAEHELCLVLDAYTGEIYPAPGNSVYLFKEMKAACADIAERWPAIKPPKKAVL